GPALGPDGPPPEPPVELAGDGDHVAVATFNAENLSPVDASHVAAVGRVIAGSLAAPDVVALQEVQDGNGPSRGELSAEATYAALDEAIEKAGGPVYRALDIAPAFEGADGGRPGANIRVAFLYRADRIGFVPRGEPGPKVAARLEEAPAGGVRLRPNPARIEPDHPAWTASRKPLVAELSFRDHPFFVVNVHFASKWGDAPLFGARQPPPTPTAGQRLAQARVVRRFVERLIDRDPRARVVVLGDMNAFARSSPVRTLVEGGLVSGIAQLPDDDRYTYVYRGNAQALDHLLISEPWAQAGFEVDAPHVHAGFPPGARASDHDPVAAKLPMR
ncbi:MAG: endonuclease/exonuclease/phosphatase family protein, partial [Myxococcota bacterium]